MLFFTSLPLFFHLSFCEALSYSHILLFAPLSSATLPFASRFLSCEKHWRWCLQPRDADIPSSAESSNRGWPAPAPHQPQSRDWPCYTFAAHTAVRGALTEPLCPIHSPICASLTLSCLLPCSLFPSFPGKTNLINFLSMPPFLSHPCQRHFSIPIKAPGSFTNHKTLSSDFTGKETEA